MKLKGTCLVFIALQYPEAQAEETGIIYSGIEMTECVIQIFMMREEYHNVLSPWGLDVVPRIYVSKVNEKMKNYPPASGAGLPFTEESYVRHKPSKRTSTSGQVSGTMID